MVNAATVTMTYDPVFNQPLTVKDALNHTAVLTYDTTGKLITAADPLGNSASVTYNSAARPVTVTSFAGTSNLESNLKIRGSL